MFSSRLPTVLAPSALAAAAATYRAAGRIRADLTTSNPTMAGVPYPETLAAAWSNAGNLDYTPDPRGLARARQLVAETCCPAGRYMGPDRVVLTASTSEAYAFLFKLLCDAGDAVAVPAPSYPLIDHLASLEVVRVDRYALLDVGRWTVDLDHLDGMVTDRTRAVVVVAPNNPTGSVPDAAEWHGLLDICARHQLALIVDEVFAPYRFDESDAAGSGAPPDPPVLTFRLNGLSKLVGLPQAKLGWIVVEGPTSLVDDALQRLEVVADTFLSVSTPVQLALPVLLRDGAAVRSAIQERLERNLGAVDAAAAASEALSLRRPQGGWSCVLRVPTPDTPDALVVALLERGVLVHPGYFYDFAHDGYLVVSLLTPPREMDLGLEVLRALPAGVP